MRLLISCMVLVSTIAMVYASNSKGLLFGGGFSVGDPYCIYCPNPNLLSEGSVGCQCPAGFTAYPSAPTVSHPWKLMNPSNSPLVRVSSTCATGGAIWHSSLSMCIADPFTYQHNATNFAIPSTNDQSQFAGFYQMVNGKCHVPNPMSQDCSCPNDSESIVIDHSSPLAREPINYSYEGVLRGDATTQSAKLVMCGRRTSSTKINFGGVYATTLSGECDSINPFTDSCSCPIGSSSTTLSLVNTNGIPITVHLCGPAHIRGPNAYICDGVSADNSGLTNAAPAINQCFMYKREVRLQLGTYLIDSPLYTEGGRIEAQQFWGQTCLVDAQPCPILRAGPNLAVPMFTGRADLYNVAFDGNRLGRLNQLGLCKVNASNGINIVQRAAAGAGGFQMQGCAVVNALCGAGLFSQIGGGWFSGAQVQSSLFKGNGDHNDQLRSWANGIQVGMGSNGFQAQQNYYVDNTDAHVGVDEPTTSVELEQSTWLMQAANNFAAIRNSYPVVVPPTSFLPDSVWNSTAPANWGNQYQQNTITCNGRCYFGIIIGGKPWNPASPPVTSQGIEVEQNTVTGAAVLINWDAGVGRLQQNSYGAILGAFKKCATPPTLLNISPDSRVDRSSEWQPSAAHYTYAGCIP